MDTKLTLSLDAAVIARAKEFAEAQNISLSRLVEIMLRKATANSYNNIEDLPIADWVMQVAEGDVTYKAKKTKRKDMKDEFFKSKK